MKYVGLVSLVFVTFLGAGLVFNKVNFREKINSIDNEQNIEEVKGSNLTDTNAASVVVASTETSKKETLKLPKADMNRAILLNAVVTRQSIDLATNLIQQLDQTSGPIYLLISSPGGSVLAGYSFIAVMQSLKNPVYTVCVDLCASMAAIIHQYGTKRFAYDNSILMFHDASGGAQGEVKQMLSMLRAIDRLLERTDRNIAAKSNIPYDKWRDMTAHNLWIDARDAKDIGLVDAVIKVFPGGARAQIYDSDEQMRRNSSTTNNERLNDIRIVPMSIGVTFGKLPSEN